jgi:hypothetical protein
MPRPKVERMIASAGRSSSLKRRRFSFLYRAVIGLDARPSPHIGFDPAISESVPRRYYSTASFLDPESDYNPNSNSARPAATKMTWRPSTVNEIGGA